MKKQISRVVIILLVAAGVCVILLLPPIRQRLDWRITELRAQVNTWLHPPEQVSFKSSDPAARASQSTAQAPAPAPSLTATLSPTLTPTPVSSTPLPSPTATLTPTPLPKAFKINGGKYFSQIGYFNYCAPANLAMALSYWGWNGKLADVGNAIKGNPKDKNVMPYEMEAYAKEEAKLGAVTRVGGDLETIKRLVSNGFPVLVELGVFFDDITGVVSWMGHYRVITGYDDNQKIFVSQDSFIEANHPVPYDQFLSEWRSFNYIYLIIFTPDKEALLMNLLGTNADPTTNYQAAAQKASSEIYQTTGRDQFFAWFNRGTNLMDLQDYAGAATAYDQAFIVYNNLPNDIKVRPYRILWYETGPFFAYFYTGRYYDVIDKATNNSINLVRDDTPALEESFYWRAKAKAALGDSSGAIQDLRKSLEYHPDFPPSLEEMKRLGVSK